MEPDTGLSYLALVITAFLSKGRVKLKPLHTPFLHPQPSACYHSILIKGKSEAQTTTYTLPAPSARAHLRFTRRRLSIKKYDCSPVHKVK